MKPSGPIVSAGLVVAEVVPDVVNAVREAGGRFFANIAHSDRMEIAEVGPLEIEDPGSESDRRRLVEAVAEAEEIATAVPSVQFYTSPSPGSIHRILAEGLRRKVAAQGPPAIVYAAENHNHAAEILEASVFEEIPEDETRACALSGPILEHRDRKNEWGGLRRGRNQIAETGHHNPWRAASFSCRIV